MRFAPRTCRHFVKALAIAALATWLGSPSALVAAEAGAKPPAAHSFQLLLESDLTTEVEGQKQAVKADTQINYTWRKRDREREVIVDSIHLKVALGGNPVSETGMSRERMLNVAGGKREEVDFDKAPAGLKKVMGDTFGTPLAAIQVDEHGEKTGEKITAGEGAKNLITNGLVANTQICHPPFHADRDQWQSNMQFSVGNGGYVQGTVTYKKRAPVSGLQTCTVSGELTNKRHKPKDEPVAVENARNIVSGELTYDPAISEWVAGQFAMEVSFDLTEGTRKVGKAGGKITVTLKHKPTPAP